MRQNDKYPHNWITYFVACQKFWIANYIKDIARSSLSLSRQFAKYFLQAIENARKTNWLWLSDWAS